VIVTEPPRYPDAPSGACQVLREDPWLLEAVPPAARARAVHECVAATLKLPRGRWDAAPAGPPVGGIGLMVIRGLLLRRVGVEGRFGAELLGEGDLLRPWHGEDAQPAFAHTTGWRALAPTELAVLDRRAAYRMARYPEVTGRLVARAIERTRHLSINMAIVHQPRVEIRLHMLLWHLASRWGRVRADGVFLPLRLTHAVLADLAAARRPTVTGALSELGRQGLVISAERGWLLRGDPPGELLELQDVEVPEDEDRAARAQAAGLPAA
jgi:CRP-like cAMP-binding protein